MSDYLECPYYLKVKTWRTNTVIVQGFLLKKIFFNDLRNIIPVKNAKLGKWKRMGSKSLGPHIMAT